MKNINRIVEKLFRETVYNAYEEGNEELESYNEYMTEDEAEMKFFGRWAKDSYDNIYEWVEKNLIKDSEKIERLADIIQKKIIRDVDLWETQVIQAACREFDNMMANLLRPRL